MENNDHINLTVDISGYSPSLTVAYIVYQANALNYFNPKLSNSDLFETYNRLMETYTSLHGSDYAPEEVEGNMECLFNIVHHLDSEIKTHIDTTFDELHAYINALLTYELNAVISCVEDEAGLIMLELPVPDVMETASDETLEPIDFAVPSDTLRARSDQAYNHLLHTMYTYGKEDADYFGSVISRLYGVSETDLAHCHVMIRVVVDCLMDEVGYQEVPGWLDIVDFLYNYGGESPMRLTEYLLKRQEWLAEGLIPNIPNHGQILFLQEHFNAIAVGAKQSTYAKPVPLRSQWVFAYADFIQLTVSYHEQGGRG